MRFPEVTLRLPDWVEEMLADPERTCPSAKDRMRLAIELSRASIRHGAGGRLGRDL
jgi:hypothetical protein